MTRPWMDMRPEGAAMRAAAIPVIKTKRSMIITHVDAAKTQVYLHALNREGTDALPTQYRRNTDNQHRGQL